MTAVKYRAMRYKLGKKPARHGAVTFLWDMFFDSKKLPSPPAGRFGHYNLIKSWGMLANDQAGDCVWAGAAHEEMMWAREAGLGAKFTDQNVLSDYSAATGFVVGRDDTDNGTDMSDAAKYRRKDGIVDADGHRHTIKSYVAIKPGNVTQLMQACYVFGAVGIGVQLTSKAMDQFDAGQPWSLVPGQTTIGGHYIPIVGRNSLGNILLVTWGRLHAATPEWVADRMDEGLVYLSTAVLDTTTHLTPENFDEAKLDSLLAAL